MRFAPTPAVLSLALALSGGAFADEPAKPADAPQTATSEEKLVLGEINGANVNVRAGNTMNHRILCVANRGDQVLIAGESGDFFKILAPKSAACWVSAQYVDRSGDTGTVKGDNVNLRPTPDTSHPVIGQLQPGDTVRITGQDSIGTYFKVEPPKGVYAFVSKKFVTVKGDYAEIRSEEARKESEKIAHEERSKASLTAWQSAEALVKAQNEAPAAERDWTEAIAAFDEIAASADEKTANRAKDRADYLRGLQELQGLVKSLDETSQVQKAEYEKRIAELEQKWQSEQAEKSVKRGSDKPAIATGWVENVASVWGRPGSHKIVEAGVTLYYLHSDVLDLRRYWHNRIRIVKGTIQDPPEGWEDGPKVIEV
ncbi:MAG: SH3 domain-containing protein, partial [Planctomycetia bacterium]|nr:SH3 domain-containing protein [Planctomycetia bacterium]